jgi:hypothetical protein
MRLPAPFVVMMELGAKDASEESVMQLPFIAKHPPERLMPTFDVVVACPTMFNPLTVVVPKPEPAISKAEIDVVAVPATVVVERYKLPPAFRNVNWARPVPAESDSWLAVDDAIVSEAMNEVEVPTANDDVVAEYPAPGWVKAS